MTLKTLFTAVGRLEKRSGGPGRSYPVIVLGGKDYMVDLQEMLVWSSLNWRIVRKEEIGALYEKAVLDYSFQTDRTWAACADRLLHRGLLVSGSGATDYDALYDLLSTMYIIPATGSLPLRLFSFIKLVLIKDVPISMARRLLQGDRRTAGEKQVMRLAGQTLMSTAEIIKCMDKGIHRLRGEEGVLDSLYNDQDTTSDNIAYLVKASASSRPVVLAVANLYLRQQIIFERI